MTLKDLGFEEKRVSEIWLNDLNSFPERSTWSDVTSGVNKAPLSVSRVNNRLW